MHTEFFVHQHQPLLNNRPDRLRRIRSLEGFPALAGQFVSFLLVGVDATVEQSALVIRILLQNRFEDRSCLAGKPALVCDRQRFGVLAEDRRVLTVGQINRPSSSLRRHRRNRPITM